MSRHATRLRFPPSRRLRIREEFDQVFRRGCKASSPDMVVYVRPNDQATWRLGLVVSRRIGHAVRRNRVRRRIRDAFRRLHPNWDGTYDLVCIPRPGITTVGAIDAALESLVRDAIRRCAARSTLGSK